MAPYIFVYLLIITGYNYWYITIKINTIKVLKQLLPALAVNIIIVHPRGVVFQPSGKQQPSGEQL
jgi:hypothetical protein